MSSINGLGSSNAWASAGPPRNGRANGAGGGPDAAEFKQKMFEKLDADGSGGIDGSELDSLLSEIAQRSGQSVGSDSASTFSSMDGNGDGSLDSSELDSGLKSLLGAPSDTMAFARMRGGGGPDPSAMKQELFNQLDSDGSGGVDSGEIDGLLTEIAQRSGQTGDLDNAATFSAMDGNGDGSLDAEELDSAMQSLVADSAGEAAGSGGMAGPGGPQGAGGPQPGPPPGPPPGASAGSASEDSDDASIDPLDTNRDGTVSATEQAAGEVRQALENLRQAADADGDQQLGGSEARSFREVLQQLRAGGARGEDAGTTGQTAARDVAALAEQVLRAYAPAAAGGGFSLAA